MTLPAFDYRRPATLSEALAMLSGDPQARAFAGGQTLLPTLKQRLARPSVLVDLQDIPELRGVKVTETAVEIGAMTRHYICLLYTSPSPRDRTRSRMPSSA